ncbi:G protein pathway suppressor 2 isoform X2 [Phycodurus eques]|uniref:G protein pathway suppressor 2 isoform X2 n=1 Tax=Phycodurus eques TaxID=693459 RepID=UPI002ACD3A49|nr:G protein pathway suppressor 2 isoform X2 [Phycodurus eques]
MPALLERPKLSNAMARALHKHIMRERERKRQEEEEVDKMMEQKMKEEEERKRTKEIEERMSLEETKEQVMKMGEKLQGLQEEKHQLFLQLKKVLHEEEKRRRKEQSDITTLTSASYQAGLPMHAGQHLLSIQGESLRKVTARRRKMLTSPLERRQPRQPQSTRRPARRSEQAAFPERCSSHAPLSGARVQFGFGRARPIRRGAGGPRVLRGGPSPASRRLRRRTVRPGQLRRRFSDQRSVRLPGHAVPAPPAACLPGPRSLHLPARVHPGGRNPPPEAAGTRQSAVGLHRRGTCPFSAHVAAAQTFHLRLSPQGALRPMHPPAMHPSTQGLLPAPTMAVQIPGAKAAFQNSPQAAPRHSFLPHGQSGQRFYHHGK